MKQNIMDFSRQCKCLQLEKKSGIEIEMPIHKTLAIDIFKGMAGKKDPLRFDRVKDFYIIKDFLALFK